MSTLYDRFAKFSGAKLHPRTDKTEEFENEDQGQDLSLELPEIVEGEPTKTEQPFVEEEPSYVEETFKKDKPIWKNPKVTLGVVSAVSLAATLAAAAIFNGQFQMPDFSKASLASDKDPNDDIAPQPPQDGQFQSAALGMGLGQGFEKEGERKNPYFEDAPAKVTPSKKVKIPGKPRADLASRTTPQPSYRTMAARSAYVPPTPVAAPATPRYSSYASTYRSAPAVRSDPPDPAASRATTQAPEKQLSPQERIAAMLAATSTGSNGAAGGSSYVAQAPQQGQYPQQVQFAQQVQYPQQAQYPQAQPAVQFVSNSSVRSAPQPTAYLPSEAAVLDGQSQTLISRSTTAKATLLNGIAFTASDYASLAGQPVEIELAQPLGQIPAGARIIAVVDPGNQRSSSGSGTKAVVRLVATAIAIGDVEFPLDPNALLLSGSDGAPLIASRGGSGFLRTLGGIIGTLAGGAGQSNFGAGQNARFGDSSYITSVGANIATGVIGNAARQLQQPDTSDVLVLKAGKGIKVSVLRPFAIPQLSQLFEPQPITQLPLEPQTVAQSFQSEVIPTELTAEPTDAQLIQIQQEVSGVEQN